MCRLFIFSILFSFACIAHAQENQIPSYQNPVIKGFYPDPSVTRVGENYYLVTSSFEYFPGVPVFVSKDLINWKKIGHCLSRNSQVNLNQVRSSGGIYAPTLRFHEGTYYMTTTNVSHDGNFIVHTQDPFSDWSDPILVDQGGIDPSLFFENNKVYYTSNRIDNQHPNGIYMSEIDISTGKRLSDIQLIWEGTGGRYPEAPHIYKKDGYYYLMIAEGGTEYGHMVTIARSKDIWGPYESNPDNPILTHRDVTTQSDLIQGTGHGDLIQAHDGSWWMAFLAFRAVDGKYHHLGRETFLAPVTWNEEGWPVVNKKGTISLNMDAETLPLQPWPEELVRDGFDDVTLDLDWNFLRNPDPASWSLTDRRGWLRLNGKAITLNDQASPTFIGQRQKDFLFEASTAVDFVPTKPDEEAGLTVFMNHHHHYDLAVTRTDTLKSLQLKYRIGSMTHIEKSFPIESPITYLKVEGTPKLYYFYYSDDGDNWEKVAEMDTRYLSSEVAGGFTGVYLGLYATGNGSANANPADFDYFEYKQIE